MKPTESKVAPKELVKAAPKAAPKPEAKAQRPQIIKETIIKEVPRAKKPPSEYNKFMTEQIKVNKMSFGEAAKLWTSNKTKSQ